MELREGHKTWLEAANFVAGYLIALEDNEQISYKNKIELFNYFSTESEKIKKEE